MSKSTELEIKMRELIRSGEWAINHRIPTEDELCRQFDVSRTTVRAALSALRAEGQLYSKPRAGTIVASGSTRRRKLYLMTGSPHASIDMLFVRNFLAYGYDHPEFELHLLYSGHDRRREAAAITQVLKEKDSLLLTSIVSSDHSRTMSINNPDRIAVLGFAPELSGLCCQINTDMESGAQMMMEHIIAMGHKRIAFLGSFLNGYRYLAWKNCQLAAGLTPDSDLVALPNLQAYDSDEKFIKYADKFFKHIFSFNEPPTAVFCVADMWANALIHTIYANGKNVPEDISVTGFDGVYLDPDSGSGHFLTTVVQPISRMIQTAVNSLLNYKGENPRILIRPTLHYGNSLAKLI